MKTSYLHRLVFPKVMFRLTYTSTGSLPDSIITLFSIRNKNFPQTLCRRDNATFQFLNCSSSNIYNESLKTII